MIGKRRRRLLTIAHSYCVALNRRLPNEIARVGDWDVTAVGPARFRGDFGWHTLEAAPGELCHVVPVSVRFGRQVHVMLYGRALSSLLAEPWDLVHCWEEPYVAAAAQIARRVAPNVPLVLATFQNIAKRYPPPFSWIERYSMSRANAVIAFGRTAAEVVASRGFDSRAAQNMAVIPPGVDLTQFRPDEARRAATLARLGWSDGIPVVGFLGRLVPEKGIELLTTTLDRMTTPWRALIVGSGPLADIVSAWGRRHPKRVRVITNCAARRGAGILERDGRAVRAEPDNAALARAVRPHADRSLCVRCCRDCVDQRRDSVRRRRRRRARPERTTRPGGSRPSKC